MLQIALDPQGLQQSQTPPWRTGWLSIALLGKAQIWIDGHNVGLAPRAYMRLPAGPHKVKVKRPKRGTKSFILQIVAGKHLSLGRQKNGKLGLYFVRPDRSEVHVYRYPKGGNKAVVEHRPPGPYCLTPKRCLFLLPGEQLYIQADGRHTIAAPRPARLAVRPYLKRGADSFLTLYSYPPGALFLNQRLYGLAPVARLPLKSGHYKARLFNGFLRVERQFGFALTAGQHLRRVVYLRPKGKGHVRITSRRPAQIFLNGEYRGWTPARVLPLKPGRHQLVLRPHKGTTVQTTFQLQPDQSRSLHLP